VEIRLLDLFSGIGGFHLGLERAGFRVVESSFSEIDKYAISVYQSHFKESINVGSVTDIRGGADKFDAITFGSPCQDFSNAGVRRGLNGERSSLISHAIRLIAEIRPKFFIWENVKGTFTSNSGSDFWAIIKAFTELGGYRLEWQLLNTAWFLPQNRERIYLVGLSGKIGGREIFPISENDRLSDNGKPRPLGIQTARCLRKNQHKAGRDDTYITYRIHEPTRKGYAEAENGDSINVGRSKSKTRRGRVGKRSVGTLETEPTQAVVYSDKIRRLTPIETERLQGFPDNWTEYGIDGEKISDTQRYKMTGNAVTVPVVEAVGRRILQALEAPQ